MLRDQYEMIIKGGNLDWCRPYFGKFDGKDIAFSENEGEVTGIVLDGKEYTNIDAETKAFQELWDIEDERIDVCEGECKNCPFFETCQAWENECVIWKVKGDGNGHMWVTIYTIDGEEHYIDVDEENDDIARAKIIAKAAEYDITEDELRFKEDK